MTANRINKPSWLDRYNWNVIRGRCVAGYEVAKAKKDGVLPILDGSIKCVDCGAPACHYDHRDYNKPLDVDPVCHRCNLLRGPAIPHVDALKIQESSAEIFDMKKFIQERKVANKMRVQKRKKRQREKHQLLLRKALIKATSINRLASFIGVSRQVIQHWNKQGVSKRGKDLLEKYIE